MIPLWARKAVCCQLEVWERSLLWQNAATPLDASGGHVGLVHLLRALSEVRGVGEGEGVEWGEEGRFWGGG